MSNHDIALMAHLMQVHGDNAVPPGLVGFEKVQFAVSP